MRLAVVADKAGCSESLSGLPTDSMNSSTCLAPPSQLVKRPRLPLHNFACAHSSPPCCPPPAPAQEAAMMASLRHPSIVMYLGVCLDPPAVVTEYCARGAWGRGGHALAGGEKGAGLSNGHHLLGS